MYKTLILLILFIGVLFVSITTMQVYGESIKPQPKTEYRYIPRSPEDEMLQPVYPSEIFSSLFSDPSPWIMSIRSYDQRKQEAINSYFVNQL
jgi:hypothetical protein